MEGPSRRQSGIFSTSMGRRPIVVGPCFWQVMQRTCADAKNPPGPAKDTVLISYGQPANRAAAEKLAAILKARFGLEGYELAPVPKETPTPEQVRQGMGHHHLGIDMDCLPAGTEIVKGTPSWVHFGTGATEIDVQLEPGPHKLTLQLGDDLHRTVEGLCQTINVTVQK